MRGHPVDEAQAEGIGGSQLAAGQQQVQGLAAADDAAQADHHHRRDQALGHLGIAEGGLVAGDHQVARHGDPAAAAQGEAVDCGDDGLGKPGQQAVQVERLARPVVLKPETFGAGRRVQGFAQVGAGAEGGAGSGQDDGADRIVLHRRMEVFVQGGQEGAVQRIARRRAIQGHHGDGAPAFRQHGRRRLYDLGQDNPPDFACKLSGGACYLCDNRTLI